MNHSVFDRQLDHRIAAMQRWSMITIPVSKRGTITLPPDMRRKLGLDAAEQRFGIAAVPGETALR